MGGDVAAAWQVEPARLRRQLVPVARLVPQEQPVALPEATVPGTAMERPPTNLGLAFRVVVGLDEARR